MIYVLTPIKKSSMKKVILASLIIFSINLFSQNTYSDEAGRWRLGVNAGAMWQTCDVTPHANIAGGFTKTDIVDGIGAAQQVNFHGADGAGVLLVSIESAIDVIPNGPRKH